MLDLNGAHPQVITAVHINVKLSEPRMKNSYQYSGSCKILCCGISTIKLVIKIAKSMSDIQET